MQKITSFTVDHRNIDIGVYVSRIDNDITTYDLRTRKPNTGDVMDNASIHSVEHMFATVIRNSDLHDKIIYFGPMGCQTGFYLLVKDTENKKVLEQIKQTLEFIINYEGEMFGASEIECGNYKNLDIALAKKECAEYLKHIKHLTENDLKYK